MSDMQGFAYAVAIYVLFLFMLFWNYGQFTIIVVRWSKEPTIDRKNNKIRQPSLSLKEVALCYIPFYQCFLVRKTLHRVGGIYGGLVATSAMGIIWNLFNKFVIPINGYVMFVSSIIMFISVFLFWLSYALVTFDCARMYSASTLVCILCLLLPHLFCVCLQTSIPKKMRALHKEEIFNGNNGDTVIKRKYNQ